MRLLSTVLPLLLAEAVAASPQVGFAKATGQLEQATKPARYQPLNLLDGRDRTAWCSRTADHLQEQLTFGFKGNVSVDEVRIHTGNAADDQTFRRFARAKKFTFKGLEGGRSVTVGDQRGQQIFVLHPPVRGRELILEIEEQYPADDPEAPVCVTDILFFSGGRPLNGTWLSPKLGYERHRAQLLGTWFAGHPGAPDRFLSFFFDGTFRLTFEPFEGPPRTLTGSYRIKNGKLTLELKGKSRVKGILARGAEDKPSRLEFLNAAHEDLRREFRDVR